MSEIVVSGMKQHRVDASFTSAQLTKTVKCMIIYFIKILKYLLDTVSKIENYNGEHMENRSPVSLSYNALTLFK